jgi:hypothetical protein
VDDAIRAVSRSDAGMLAAKALYSASYTISFAVVFPVALIVLSIPRDNAAIRGLIEGAEAASRRVDRLLARSPG